MSVNVFYLNLIYTNKINNTDYTFNLVQLRPSLIVLVSGCIGIKHCKFIKQLGAI